MTFFISFSDRDGNKGVVITDCEDPKQALEKITTLGLVPAMNTDGEAMVFSNISSDEIARFEKDKLIKPEVFDSMNYARTDTGRKSTLNN